MKHLNSVVFVGLVGIVRQTTSRKGTLCVRFSLGMDSSFTDEDTGELVEYTTWAECSCFGSVASFASNYMLRGDLVGMKGRYHVRKRKTRGQEDMRQFHGFIVDQLTILHRAAGDLGPITDSTEFV